LHVSTLYCAYTYREVDRSFGPASLTGQSLVNVVGELAVLAVEDEPAPAPRPDASSHLDQKASRTVRRDGDVGGAADDEVSGLLDKTQQVQRLAADW